MVGVLTGDALGAPYETWKEEDILADVTRRGGLVLFDYDDPWGKDGRFPKGRPTDDSEMTAALAEYLLTGSSDLEDLYQLFRQCAIEHKSFLCELKAYGFGGTTRRSLAEKTYEEALLAPSQKIIPTNGALMRCVPVALRYAGRPDSLTIVAWYTAQITHRHKQAIDATLLYVHVLDGILSGLSYTKAVARAVWEMEEVEGDRDILNVLRSPGVKPAPPEKFGGSALYSLQVVHWAVGSSSSFEEGITKAVTIGSDVDTYGAIAGGLLGALYGASSIPGKWRKELLGEGRMQELADQLYEAHLAM